MRASKSFTQWPDGFCYTRSFPDDKCRISRGLYPEIGVKSSYNASYARSFRTDEPQPPVATRMVSVSHCQIELTISMSALQQSLALYHILSPMFPPEYLALVAEIENQLEKYAARAEHVASTGIGDP